MNQAKSFSTVKAGSVTVNADSINDTLQLTAGNNISFEKDSDAIKINSTYSYTLPIASSTRGGIKIGY